MWVISEKITFEIDPEGENNIENSPDRDGEHTLKIKQNHF